MPRTKPGHVRGVSDSYTHRCSLPCAVRNADDAASRGSLPLGSLVPGLWVAMSQCLARYREHVLSTIQTPKSAWGFTFRIACNLLRFQFRLAGGPFSGSLALRALTIAAGARPVGGPMVPDWVPNGPFGRATTCAGASFSLRHPACLVYGLTRSLPGNSLSRVLASSEYVSRGTRDSKASSNMPHRLMGRWVTMLIHSPP
jgi:hypothetical protein